MVQVDTGSLLILMKAAQWSMKPLLIFANLNGDKMISQGVVMLQKNAFQALFTLCELR